MEDLTLEEKNALIKEKPEYGSIVCRCEMITEGEIMDAINRPLGARTMDGVARQVSVLLEQWKFFQESLVFQ